MPKIVEVPLLKVEDFGFHITLGVIKGLGDASLMPTGMRRQLKPVEMHALQNAYMGNSQTETADDRGIAPDTVRTHRGNGAYALRALNLGHSLRRGLEISAFCHPESSVRDRIIDSQNIDELTEAEAKVVALISQGLSNDQIAVKRETSVETVKTQIGTACGHLNAKNRMDAVRRALISGQIK